MKKNFLLLNLIMSTLTLTAGNIPLSEIHVMEDKINAYAKQHTSARTELPKLTLVYFHPSDMPPQHDYKERISLNMLDIQNFYRSEMVRNGFSSDCVFRIKRKNGLIDIPTVKGKHPLSYYSYNSGGEIRKEIAEAFGDEDFFTKNYVLIFSGLSTKNEDDSYSFNAPYYGAGANNKYGICFVLDCEKIDIRLIGDRKDKVRYSEHTGSFYSSLSDFEIRYIGGTAHELGHALTLPHNMETAEERKKMGRALMGSGNYSYRADLVGGKGTFLTQASAVRLASHPLFTGGTPGLEIEPECLFDDVDFEKTDKKTLTVTGKISASPEAYALVVYLDPEPYGVNNDYDAHTAVSSVTDGNFSLTFNNVPPGNSQLRFVVCHLNGAVSNKSIVMTSDSKTGPDVKILNEKWDLGEIVAEIRKDRIHEVSNEVNKLLKSGDLSPEMRKKLTFINEYFAALKRAPIDISECTPGKEITLSDAKWEFASVGWAVPQRNIFILDSQDESTPFFLESPSRFYTKGLYAHTPSTYIFNLDGKFTRFTADASLEKGVSKIGNACFIVKGDGKVLYRSRYITGDAPKTKKITCDITGVKRLELITKNKGQSNICCWAFWGNPRVQ